MSRKIRVLTLQFNPVIANKQTNFGKVSELIEKNCWFNPDLVILPEVFNIGAAHKYFQKMAEEIPNGETSLFLSNLAKKFHTNIIGGSFPEKADNGKYKNTCCVYDRNGKLVAKYSKIHMFSYYGSKEGDFLESGNEAVIANLDIGKIGLGICYDLRFPELFRSLVYSGAKIIALPAAWPYPRLEHWTTLSKARAIENLCYVITSNHCAKTTPSRLNLGHSSIINPWGEIIACAGSEEGVAMAEIDLNFVKKVREEFRVLEDRNLNAYNNIIL
ncbi:MAG: carbon-nitrogen family hydrolase [bacterium]